MKRMLITILIMLFAAYPVFAKTFGKVGTGGMQFLKLGVDARALGMGEAYTAVSDDISSIYWNPAGLALKDNKQLFFSHTQYIAETYHEYVAFSTMTDYGTLGILGSVFYTSPMDETTEEEFGPTGRQFRYSAMIAGLTYSNAFTDKFSFGLSSKYLQENIADESSRGFSIDVGTMYNTMWHNVTIGMSLRNFGGDVSYDIAYDESDNSVGSPSNKSGNSVKLPMNYSMGLSGDLMRQDNSYLIGSFQIDNTVDRPETWNFGAEYNISAFFLRTGYQINYDAASYSFGFGVRVPTRIAIFNVDYAYTDMGRLKEDFLTSAHRLSLKMAF